MEDSRIKLLRDEPISKAVNKMSIPAIIGLLVMAVYNIVDTMFVAWLGTEATGATQVVFPIMMLISSFGLAFGIGGGSYISRLLGDKDYTKANEVASTAFFTTLLLGIVFTIGGITFLEEILRFFGASAGIMAMAKDYGLYIVLGTVFTMSNMALNNMLRSEGSARISMTGQAAGAVINIILDPIFIFGFGWGIAGAAVATSLSQGITFIILLSKYLKRQSVAQISLLYFKPSKEIYSQIMMVGIPTFFRQILVSVSMGVLNNGAVMYGGEDLIAAVGLIMKVYLVPMYVLFGVGQGMQPVVGFNHGAKHDRRVIETLKYSLRVSFLIALASAVVLFAFPDVLLSIFRPTDEVMAYGVIGLRFSGMVILLLSFSNTIGVFYQAIGKGKESLILAVARQGVLFIPLVYILPLFFGTTGVLGAQFAADILTALMTGVMFYRFVKGYRATSIDTEASYSTRVS